MTEQWYYWHESEIQGPFSGKKLTALAAAGDILSDDIVWKDGVQKGVPAHRVRHLFAAPLPTPAIATVECQSTPAGEAAEVKVGTGADVTEATVAGAVEEVPKASWDRGLSKSSGKAHAVAGKGTTIVSQDGTTVRFRMKCTVCGYEDTSWQSMAITRGTFRKIFYCPKCRKRCGVQIYGQVN
jgi:hypothetical protein